MTDTNLVPPSAVAMARYVTSATWDSLSSASVEALKVRLLDSFGCAGGALEAEPIASVRWLVNEYGGTGPCTLIGEGTKTAPDRAALYNSALVRYLDYNDSHITSRGGGGHPSDNIGGILAAAELAGSAGKKFLVGLALAYQVQCRMTEEASATRILYDHPTVGAYSSAAGISHVLGLSVDQTASAIGMAGASQNCLYVTRTGDISHWKGLAFPHVSASVMNIALLAKAGITGPSHILEGAHGFIETFTEPFFIDWETERLDSVTRTVLKKYVAQIHSQAPIEALIELCAENAIDSGSISAINLKIFQKAYDVAGGGASGPKKDISNKEQADHSLPYMLAVAAIDGALGPSQYDRNRILADDVQQLLRKVTIEPDSELTARFPKEFGCRIQVALADGAVYEKHKTDYEGYLSRPMRWETVEEKARGIWQGVSDLGVFDQLCDVVWDLENREVSELCDVLSRIRLVSR